MSRLDWESGRFDADYEANDTFEAIAGWQSTFGDNVLYYRFWSEETVSHRIFDEATGVGRVWHPPSELQVLHVTRKEGDVENREQGLYYNDTLYLTASFDQLRRLGLTELDIAHQSYLKDRIVYDFRVFRVQNLQVLGQVQRRDMIVSIEATQVKPDEMLNDEQFTAFARPGFPVKP